MQLDVTESKRAGAAAVRFIAEIEELEDQRQDVIDRLAKLEEIEKDARRDARSEKQTLNLVTAELKAILPEGAVRRRYQRKNELPNGNRIISNGRIFQEVALSYRLAYIFVARGNELIALTDLMVEIHKPTLNPEDGSTLAEWQTSSKDPRNVVFQTLNQDCEFVSIGQRCNKEWSLSPAAFVKYSG